MTHECVRFCNSRRASKITCINSPIDHILSDQYKPIFPEDKHLSLYIPWNSSYICTKCPAYLYDTTKQLHISVKTETFTLFGTVPTNWHSGHLKQSWTPLVCLHQTHQYPSWILSYTVHFYLWKRTLDLHCLKLCSLTFSDYQCPLNLLKMNGGYLHPRQFIQQSQYFL